MDKIEQYRQIIQQVLQNHAQLSPSRGNVEAQVICDRDHDHYQLAYVGWESDSLAETLRERRVFGPILHFDIKDGKIWIQYNGTEEHIGETLVKLGVPAQDIVLGFRSAFKRQFSGYAVE
jgi:XisI protein